VTTTTILGTEAQHQLEAMDPAEFRKAFAEGRCVHCRVCVHVCCARLCVWLLWLSACSRAPPRSALPWPEEIGAMVQKQTDEHAAKLKAAADKRKAREGDAMKGIEIPAQSL
jgi:hypothetical protein